MAQPVNFLQSFETDTAGITTGGTRGTIDRVASAPGISAAADGAVFGVANESAGLNGSGPFTNFGGASTDFLEGTTTGVKVYLNSNWSIGEGFQYSVAANGSDGNHQRDFVFRVTVDAQGELKVGAATGSTFGPIAETLVGATTVATSGWYTLQHVFKADNTSIPPVLAV